MLGASTQQGTVHQTPPPDSGFAHMGPIPDNTGRYGYLMMLVTIRSSSVAWRRPGLSGWGGPGGRFGVYFGGGLVIGW